MAAKVGEIIHFGEIDWFGGYSKKKMSYINYGFLKGRIHFHATVFDTPELKFHIENGINDEPVFFSLKNENDTTIGASWVKLVAEMSDEELLKLYRQSNTLKEEFNDPTRLLQILDFPNAKVLCKEYFLDTKPLSFLKTIRDNRIYLRQDSSYFLIQNIAWEKLTKQEALDCFLAFSGYTDKRSFILRKFYPAWTEDDRIIKSLKITDFPECINENLIDNDFSALVNLLSKVSDKTIKKKIADFLPYEQFLSNPEYCKALPDEKLAEIIREEVSIHLDEKKDKYKTVISIIQPTGFPNSAVALGQLLLSNQLPLDLWKWFNPSEKVWFALYLSMHLEEYSSWMESYSAIYKYEHDDQNKPNYSVFAAIEYLRMLVIEKEKRQMVFESAHSYIEKAITFDFTNYKHPSDELMQLVCRCKRWDCDSVCAARLWRDTIWCNANRKKCDLFNNDEGDGVNFQKTNYVYRTSQGYSNSLCDLSMADLLNKTDFIPALDKVYSVTLNYRWGFEEYPYRIAGRILQLSRLFTHMHCKCGKLMKSDYGTSIKIDAKMSITRAYCPDSANGNQEEHDANVYLNECWNCDEVIDSRECRFVQTTHDNQYHRKEEGISGYYVCIRCGAGVKNIPPAICPSCGCTNQELLTFESRKRIFKECRACNYSRRDFVSEIETERRENNNIVNDNMYFVPIETEELPF